MADTVSRSWFAAFPNPEQHGYTGTPEEIVEKLKDEWISENQLRKGWWGYCISAKGLPHVHMVLEDSGSCRFTKVKKAYPTAHLEPTKGNKKQVLQYIHKEPPYDEKGEQVLSYLLRIGEYEPFAGKTIGNNVYMDMRGKKAVFKRTRLTYERNNIFATIKRLAKKYKPDYEGKVYLETVRCFFTISEEELEKCRYNYKGKDTYAFVMSDRYIMALYTYCLSARKAVALENIEMEGLSEAELAMVKLESVREVLFQTLLLDDVKFEDGKMYAELCSIYLLE